jgi:HK97 family phage portal protein
LSMLNWLGRVLGGSPPRSAPQAAEQRGDGGVIITSAQQLADYLRGSGNASAAGAAVTEETAMKVAVAYRCTSILSGATAGLPLDLYVRVDEKQRRPATGLRLRRTLTVRPNAWQTPFEFRKHMTANVVMHGQAAALKVRSQRYGLELWPLKGGSVKARLTDDGQLVYDQQMPSGKISHQADAVFFLRGLTLDGLNGLGVLSAARQSIGVALRGEEANAGLFSRGRIGTGAVKSPNALSQAAYDRLKADFNSEYAGAENAHKVMILEEGLDWASGAFNADDLQFIESRSFTSNDIGKFFGVPPHMYGDSEKSTSWGTGIEQQTLGFIKFTLMDYVSLWDQSIARDLLSDAERDTIYAKHDFNGLMRGDAAARAQFYQAMRSIRAMSANEVRALEEMEPYAGGDTYENPAIDVNRGNGNELAQSSNG